MGTDSKYRDFILLASTTNGGWFHLSTDKFPRLGLFSDKKLVSKFEPILSV